MYISVWKFPDIGIPLNHVFEIIWMGFFHSKPSSSWGAPIYGNHHIPRTIRLNREIPSSISSTGWISTNQAGFHEVSKGPAAVCVCSASDPRIVKTTAGKWWRHAWRYYGVTWWMGRILRFLGDTIRFLVNHGNTEATCFSILLYTFLSWSSKWGLPTIMHNKHVFRQKIQPNKLEIQSRERGFNHT